MAEPPSASPDTDSQGYPLPVDVNLLLVNPAGEVLFERRNPTGYPGGIWNLPSGPLKAGESAVSALVRTAYEVIGLIISEEAMTFAHVMHISAGSGRLTFFSVVRNWGGDQFRSSLRRCSVEVPPFRRWGLSS
jgi:8-oxo-dGTP diphosphatase